MTKPENVGVFGDCAEIAGVTKSDIIDICIAPILEEITGFAREFHGTPQLLFNKGGMLDSMGLLSLVVMLEERVNDKLGKSIRLVSEHTMSQGRSPFRTVDSLADYILELL